MANVIFNKVIAQGGQTAKERYDAMTHEEGTFYLVGSELYLGDVLLSANIAEEISYDNTTTSMTADDVQEAIDELHGLDADKKVYVEDASSGQSDYAKVYNFYQGSEGSSLSPVAAELIGTINIPLDKVVQAGSVVEVVFVEGTGGDPDSLHEGDASGPDVTTLIKGSATPTEADAGKYIKLELQNVTDPLYIAVKDLVDLYTGGTNDEATVTIDGNNVITVTIGKIAATKVIYQEAADATYEQLDGTAVFDENQTYYTYDSATDTYSVDDTVTAANFADKVTNGLYIVDTPAVAEINVKDQIDTVDGKVDNLADYVGTFTPEPGVETVIDYVDTKTGEGVGALNSEAGIASVSSNVVTIKAGIVETEGLIDNSPSAVSGTQHVGYYEDGKFWEEPQVEGYLNPSDGLFYEEDTYTTEIPAVIGQIYKDLSDDKTYEWDDTLATPAYVEATRTEITPNTTDYYTDTPSNKNYKWTGKAYTLISADIVLEEVAVTGAAVDVSYDNTTSQMTADDVQEAIDEIAGKLTWNEV